MKKVAIIGSGISGLSISWLLNKNTTSHYLRKIIILVVIQIRLKFIIKIVISLLIPDLLYLILEPIPI